MVIMMMIIRGIDYPRYCYLIIYERRNEIFKLKKIIYLLKNEINTDEVRYVTSKYVEVEDPEPYCTFNFKSMHKISENEFILSYKTKIVTCRDQDYFYITDNNYRDEVIYYKLNIENDDFMQVKIGSSNENSFLIENKKEKILYYLYKNKENCVKELKNILDETEINLIDIKIEDKMDIKNIFIQKNIFIGNNENKIYYGNIIDNKLEVTYIFNINKNKQIKYLSLQKKCIFYSKFNKNIDSDSSDNNDNSEEEINKNDNKYKDNSNDENSSNSDEKKSDKEEEEDEDDDKKDEEESNESNENIEKRHEMESDNDSGSG